MKIKYIDNENEKGFIFTPEWETEKLFLDMFFSMFEDTNGVIGVDYNYDKESKIYNKFKITTYRSW